MGIIKEPAGIDLNISPMPVTEEDRKALSAVITHYKQTGEIPKSVRKTKTSPKKRNGTPVKRKKRTKTPNERAELTK